MNADGINVPDPLSLESLEGRVSAEEWRLRCELAATYRLVALYGWDDMIFTHLSVRLPDEDGAPRFLLNPYGVFFDEMTASALLKIDAEGRIVAESPYISSPFAFTVHSALHLSRDDACAVLHLHTPYGVAVSAQKEGLRRLTQFSMIVHDDVAYHDYEGLATDLDERERIVADMDGKRFLILKNHGTLTIGQNCAVAFLRMYFLEQACRTQILAQTGAVIEGDAALGARVQGQGAGAFTPGLGDRLAWPGLMRRLTRENPGWER
ncbi:MAG: class II aldolase/adducin family protein [Pseudomonadota bacterium]